MVPVPYDPSPDLLVHNQKFAKRNNDVTHGVSITMSLVIQCCIWLVTQVISITMIL